MIHHGIVQDVLSSLTVGNVLKVCIMSLNRKVVFMLFQEEGEEQAEDEECGRRARAAGGKTEDVGETDRW